jgi:5-methylcytosine-specific restriction endonuclease McrA
MKKQERQQVFEKCNGRCAYCGCELQKGWHVDHNEPVRRGERYVYDVDGKRTRKQDGEYLMEYYEIHPERNNVENYMPACPSCNINKHSDTIEEFRNNIQGYLNSLNLRMVQYKMVKKYGLVEETNKPVVFYFETLNNNTCQ